MNSVILKKCQFCVSLFIGVHLYHSQIQNPFGITAVGYNQLYYNLMCVCEYVQHQFITHFVTQGMVYLNCLLP